MWSFQAGDTEVPAAGRVYNTSLGGYGKVKAFIFLLLPFFVSPRVSSTAPRVAGDIAAPVTSLARTSPALLFLNQTAEVEPRGGSPDLSAFTMQINTFYGFMPKLSNG